MHERYGEHIYRQYGFLDAFNPSFDLPMSRCSTAASCRASAGSTPTTSASTRARSCDDREPPQRAGLERDAQEPAHPPRPASAPASPAAGCEQPRATRDERAAAPQPALQSRLRLLACSSARWPAAPRTRRRPRSRPLLGDGPRGRGRRASCMPDFERAHPGIRVERAADALDRGAREAADRLRRRRHARRLPARQHLDPRVRGARRARAAGRAHRRLARRSTRRLLPRHLGHQRHRRHGCTACRGTSTRACCSTAATCCAQAGFAAPPRDWDEWRAAMAAIKARGRADALRDPPAAQRVRAAARAGAAAGRAAAARRRHAAAISAAPASGARSTSTRSCSTSGWAPPVSNNQISNV